MKKILVTGAGSLLGQGIIKTLKYSKSKFKIIGTDYFRDAIGLYWVSKGYILPDILKRKKNLNIWKKKILKIIKKEKINYLIPGLDFELIHISRLKDKIESLTNCKVIISNIKTIKIFQDKWLTVKFLKKNNFLFPKSTLPLNINKFLKKNKFPLIVKSRKGSTSKNVYLVKNKKELKNAINECHNPIVQEYLYSNENEYTCGTISNSNKLISAITLRRKLKNGNTIKAVLKSDQKFKIINDYVKKITNKINPIGPLNFQLCLTKRGPVIFEINPRFSGTTPLRSLFGLNEIDLLIKSIQNQKYKAKYNFKYGTIIRYFDNYFIKKEKKML